MTTWRDVERVHRAHPNWTAPMIASHLSCSDGYVRATAQRRGLNLPNGKTGKRTHAQISVPLDRIEKIRFPRETPSQCLKRIVNRALVRAWARAA